MDRRQFLTGSMGILGGAGIASRLAAAGRNSHAPSIQVKVDAGHVLGAIAPDFMGLGYETASVATPGLLSGKNRAYIQLVRTLGRQGVIRVGGNVSDYSVFSPEAPAKAAPERQTTVVNAAVIQDLGEFLDATGWKLIWGLNLGSGTPQQAVEEAQAVAAAAQDKLLALEIGNEPDLFHGAHRPPDYGYAEFHEGVSNLPRRDKKEAAGRSLRRAGRGREDRLDGGIRPRRGRGHQAPHASLLRHGTAPKSGEYR